jgi:hypothetical protein
VTPDVERFLSERIDSVEQLEALLLLQRHPDRWWTASAVASDLGGDPPSVARSLDTLCARNLLDVRIAQDVLFRFAPRASDAATLRNIAEAYRTHRMVVLQLLSRQIDSARDFADAFRLRGRKEPDRG